MAIQMIMEPKQVFSNTVANPGEGYMIAMKLVLQAFEKEKPFLVFSPGILEQNAMYLNFSSIVTENPLAAARGLANSRKNITVLVFSDNLSTELYLDDFKNVSENIVFICCNTAGSSKSDECYALEKQLSRQILAKYAATASVAFPEDLMRKIERAKNEKGFVFLEIHCPSPKCWGFDPSNTIEVSSAAVNSNIWPLLEYIGNSVVVNYRPDQYEPVENYVKIQKRLNIADLEKIKNAISENMKLLSKF